MSLMPHSASFDSAVKDGRDFIDTTHSSEGYVTVFTEPSKKSKLQVRTELNVTNYDIGGEMVIPLTMGSGSYTLRIMRNVTGSSYREALRVDAKVSMRSPFEPFLHPNSYCAYSQGGACSRAARVACKDTDAYGLITEVYGFAASMIAYDYDKAKAIEGKSGYVPDPDKTLSEGKGVCFDYAAVAAAMLRTLGVPARLVTGTVSPKWERHAWVEAYAGGKWRRIDPTIAALGKRVDREYRTDIIY